jgi:hypothetical protein
VFHQQVAVLLLMAFMVVLPYLVNVELTVVSRVEMLVGLHNIPP